ncbi:hypothetical protein [Brevibacterium samyangense]|uniref:Uncharacterized protein n=1 Tax=Brevibacterium samyangense TaxID=366888 RepID=A0ABN2TIN2_9MICO
MDITEVDPFGEDELDTIDSFSRWRIENPDSLEDVLAFLDRAAGDDAENTVHHRFLVTLDALDQCVYTSMHAAEDEALRLDDVEVEDTPESLHAFDRAQLAHIVSRFTDPAFRVEAPSLIGRLPAEDADIEVLARLNTDPDDALDAVLMVQALPLEHVGDPDDDPSGHSADLLAGLPNGYFSDDLDVFENHALVRHLAGEYGYRLFGIGASLLGLVRPEPLGPEAAAHLTGDLARLYGGAEAPAWSDFTAAVSSGRVLLVGYTSGFAEGFGPPSAGGDGAADERGASADAAADPGR